MIYSYLNNGDVLVHSWLCGHCGVTVAAGTVHYCPKLNGEISYATPESEEVRLLREVIRLLQELKEQRQ